MLLDTLLTWIARLLVLAVIALVATGIWGWAKAARLRDEKVEKLKRRKG
jgi:hypothetical protein